MIKILSIGVIQKENAILLRKKPDGSMPYKQTWYLFGGEVNFKNSPKNALIKQVFNQTNVEIKPLKLLLPSFEIKNDLDKKKKLFIYINYLCKYVSGDLKIRDNMIEKLEWVEIGNLAKYDLVPPTRKLFHKMGLIKGD